MKVENLSPPSCIDCKNKANAFCSLINNEKEELTAHKSYNFFKKGQIIFHEGNHHHGLYCVHSGKIKLSKLGEEGKEQIIRFSNDGDLLGYRSVLSNEPYSATATAMDDCYVCLISKDTFFGILKSNSNFSLDVIQLLSTDLRNSEQKLVNISQKPAKERIAETLLVLLEKFGTDKEGNLDLKLTRREIGNIAGITTETTIRTLSDFNKKGLIELAQKNIKIIDSKSLIKLANIYD